MKVKEYKAETERRVLISMVLDVGVLGRMAGIWKPLPLSVALRS